MTLGSVDRRSISLVAIRDDCEGDNLGKGDTESAENETSPSLVLPSPVYKLLATAGNNPSLKMISC